MGDAGFSGRELVARHGREYGQFRRGQYMLPHDEKEHDRLDMMHTMIKRARPAGSPIMELTYCPPDCLSGPGQARVLDLGCGTGLWMNEMAEQFPQAEFMGVDLFALGGANAFYHPNVVLHAPWDYEVPWALAHREWDLIHLQMGLGSVSDWPRLYRQVLSHLRPGSGYFESVEVDFEPRCDDGTLQPGELLSWWHTHLTTQYAAVNRRITYDPATGDLLAAAGFTNIRHSTFRIPMYEWSRVRHEHRASTWWALAMSPGNHGTGGYGFEAMSLAPLCDHARWHPTRVKRLCADALKEAADPEVHAYNTLQIWTAMAPSHQTDP